MLETMALGVPVRTTSAGCQGIEVTSGKHLFKEETRKPLLRGGNSDAGRESALENGNKGPQTCQRAL